MVAADNPYHEHDDASRSCPLCVLLDAVDGARPEVATHLRAAGREIGLALRAALEQMPATKPDADEGRGGLRRVRLDDTLSEDPPDGRT